MRNTWGALFWKEWRELRWKCSFCTALLVGFLVIALRARLISDEAVLMSAEFAVVFLAPLFVTMGLVAEERSAGSFTTLQALPVGMSNIYMIKSLGAGLAVLIPILAVGLTFVVMTGAREMGVSEVVHISLGTSVITLCVLLWAIALTARVPSETWAAGAVCALFVGWWLILDNEGIRLNGALALVSHLAPFAPAQWFTQRIGVYENSVMLGLVTPVVSAALVWVAGMPWFARAQRRGS